MEGASLMDGHLSLLLLMDALSELVEVICLKRFWSKCDSTILD
jgi:hypothetical protein